MPLMDGIEGKRDRNLKIFRLSRSYSAREIAELIGKGSASTPEGARLPQLRRLTVEVNRHGKLNTTGLPRCRMRELRSTTPAQAPSACGNALLGGGRYSGHIAIPGQKPIPSRGRLLAFNSTRQGRQVILLHAYATVPAPISRVVTVNVTHLRHGPFGTSLSARLPRIAAGWSYVTSFSLSLGRIYADRGRLQSVVTAGCPAPAGFNVGIFTAARGTLYIAGGQSFTRVLRGACQVSD